jgi:hypothetical protein
MVTFPPVGVDNVKPDLDTVLTLPIDPPVAGPDRAFDPPPPDPDAPEKPAGRVPLAAVAAGTDAAAAEPPLEAALTIPNVPAAITMVAMPAARNLVDLRAEVSLRESIGTAPLFDGAPASRNNLAESCVEAERFLRATGRTRHVFSVGALSGFPQGRGR